MTLFIQLLLAHLTGDFILQPAYIVADKNDRKLRSRWLYMHCTIHGLLVLIFTGSCILAVGAADRFPALDDRRPKDRSHHWTYLALSRY